MRGIHGLTLVIFGILVWSAQWAQIGIFRDLDARVLQAIAILAIFGLAICIVGLLRHIIIRP